MTYPNLFIMGAPKCGTTTLYKWLEQNHAIGSPKIKEPHYYYNPYGNNSTAEKYFSIYGELDRTYQYYIDASVWYLFSESAAEKILRDSPEAKFVVCLRNPIELAPSLHNQKIASGHEAIDEFRSAFRLNQERSNGKFTGIMSLPKSADPKHMAYREACLLGRQLDSLFRTVSKERVFICFLDDMAKHPESIYADICDFLGVPASDIDYITANKARTAGVKSLEKSMDWLRHVKRKMGIRANTRAFAWLHKLNRIEARYPDLDDDMVLELRNTFAEDIALLERLTGRNLSKWLET